MADYDIFREQLAITFPTYGHALWDPSPMRPSRPVEIGNVGFIRWGRFHLLFNALLPADDPSHELGVPEYHEPLVPNLSNHINTSSLGYGHYCSGGISVEPELETRASGPDDPRQVSYMCPRRRPGALLSLPVKARRENTLAQGDFGEWMLKHIDRLFVFVRRLGLGIEQEEIILITGCDRTRSWVNVAFLESQVDGQVSFATKAVDGPNASIDFQFSPENVRGAVLNSGPEGTNLSENQCVFIRGFRVARPLRILPKRLKAAAGPSPDLDGFGSEPGMNLVSISGVTEHRDPLHHLLDYIAERSPDCGMVLIHDTDLERINGIGDATTLRSDVLMDLLRMSHIEICKVDCRLPQIDLSPSSGRSNTDTAVVRVALLSMIFQNWSIIHRSQGSPHSLAAQSTGVDLINDTSATRPPTLSNPSSVPDIRPDINMYRRQGDDHSPQIPGVGYPRIIQQEHSLARHDDIPGLEPFQSMWESALPSPLEKPGADVPHFIGYVETTTDALRLITAVRQGVIPRITQCLSDSERRSMIRSGAVFVFCVEESGIKRWKDGLSWSPSRIVGNFLMYRQVGKRHSNRGFVTKLLPPASTLRVVPPSTPANSYYPSHGRPGGGARDPGGAMRPSDLIKKTITVKVSGTDHHLVSYYREEDVARGLLKRPTNRPDIMRLTIPPEMVRATNFRHPPHIEIGSDGIAHIYDAEEVGSSRRPYDRALPAEASAPKRSALKDQIPAYPIQQSGAYPPYSPPSNFNPEGPLGHHFPQVPSGHTDAAWPLAYSCLPPTMPGHGDPSTSPPLGARSSQPWSPAGAPLHEADPTHEHALSYMDEHRRSDYDATGAREP